MKTKLQSLFVMVAVMVGVHAAAAQAPVMSSFSENGILVCSNLAPGSVASLEWASAIPNGPWSNWPGMEAVLVDSNGMIQLNVPMWFRVRGVAPVVADFAGSPTTGLVPLAVSFINLSSGATNYSWEFGDGNTSTTVNCSNIYTNAGSYTVTLTAIGPGGIKSLARTSYIVAINDPTPAGMVLIPAGAFTMGDTFSDGNAYNGELPVHTVNLSAFFIDKYEVTKALWDEVHQWAITNGYSFEYGAQGKAANHPANSIAWYDAVKWCNARSEKEGLLPAYYTEAAQTNVYRTGQTNVLNDWVKWTTAYRLPTEAEWEKAARGGASAQRFPWTDVDTISHSRANYYVSTWHGTNYYVYDVSPTPDYNPTWATGDWPFTSPVGSFAANGYGLYDMAGNVWEWCWDWFDQGWYSNVGATQDDTRGPVASPWGYRVRRGGRWNAIAYYARCASRGLTYPANYSDDGYYGHGFRCVRGL